MAQKLINIQMSCPPPMCLLCYQRLCSIIAYSQPAHQYITVVDKLRQMLSSILPACAFSPLPPMSFSPLLSLGRPTHFIRIFVCLSQFLFGHPGAQVQSSLPIICMEIGFSRGIHWGHSRTSTVDVGTDRDSADIADV